MPIAANPLAAVLIAGRCEQPLEEWLPPALRSIREHLGMDVAFVSQFRDGRRFLTHVDALDPAETAAAGSSAPLEETYCQRVIDGSLPELIPDVTLIREAPGIAATAHLSIASHVSVPIRLDDGQVHGTFCCFSHEPSESLNDRDLNVMRVFADLIGAQISRELETRQAKKIIEDRIRAVISDGSMTMVYQPIQTSADNRVVGLEALARFSALPLRSPDIWFSQAEQAGLGVELECHAIELALREAQQLPPNVYVAINASPRTFLSGRFKRLVEQWPLHRLVLEVTEHAFVKSYGELECVLRPLRARQLRLAVDDFGSGYANFQHILCLKPDLIKIDIAITRHIDSDPARRAVASALVGFESETGIEIIAEGVETAQELTQLRELGVRNVQGFFLSEPMPIADAVEFTHRSQRFAKQPV